MSKGKKCDNMVVNIIGAGLAGCECAYILAKNNIKVKLYEMKPNKKSAAHNSNDFAELVCSNSLKSNAITNACGLLKEEMRRLDSLIIEAADNTYFFATNIGADSDATGGNATEITMSILSDMNIWK